MASISLDFGSHGFRVAISSKDGGKILLSGANPVDELSINFNTPANSTATTTDANSTPISRANAAPGTVLVTHLPIDIDASLSFRDEDSCIAASWRVGPYTISGKGKGKGLGKSTTIVPTPR